MDRPRRCSMRRRHVQRRAARPRLRPSWRRRRFASPPADDEQRFKRILGAAGRLGEAGWFPEALALLDSHLAAGLEGSRRARALLLRILLGDDVEKGRQLIEAAV